MMKELTLTEQSFSFLRYQCFRNTTLAIQVPFANLKRMKTAYKCSMTTAVTLLLHKFDTVVSSCNEVELIMFCA